MREILFRAKGDTEYNDGDWYYGVPIQCYDGDWQICTDALRRTVILETIGEYTGLTDKNGTKIFEGDIIEGICHSVWSHRNQRCVVEWNNTKAKFECRHYIGEPLNSDYYTYAVKFSKNVEVVGNIYDNKELIT